MPDVDHRRPRATYSAGLQRADNPGQAGDSGLYRIRVPGPVLVDVGQSSVVPVSHATQASTTMITMKRTVAPLLLIASLTASHIGQHLLRPLQDRDAT